MKKYLIPAITIILLMIVGYFVISYSQKELKKESQITINQNNKKGSGNPKLQFQFLGKEGEKISLANGQISLTAEISDDNLVHYYNTETPDGKRIYFFVVKDKNGVYRAAANACQVCFDARMGFRQEGDFMVCNTCDNKYPLEKIATEKGGCNPGPINPNLEVKNNKIIIKQSDLEQVADFF